MADRARTHPVLVLAGTDEVNCLMLDGKLNMQSKAWEHKTGSCQAV